MTKIEKEIRKQLQELKDEKYKSFNHSLIPGVDDEFIGVRTPELKALAKKLSKEKDIQDFLDDLPHHVFEENQLHAFIINEIKDYTEVMSETEKLLPYVNNWATCDQLSPKAFKKDLKDLLKKCKKWIASKETYTIRFGVGMLMRYFLDEEFDDAYPKLVAKIHSDEYYVKMMVAWYFATALAKQYDSVIGYLEDKKLDPWVHNKTISKAIESYRVSDEHKDYLKTLRIKKD